MMIESWCGSIQGFVRLPEVPELPCPVPGPCQNWRTAPPRAARRPARAQPSPVHVLDRPVPVADHACFSRFAISAGTGLDLIATPLPRPPTLLLHLFLFPQQPPFYPSRSLYSSSRRNHTSDSRIFISHSIQVLLQVSSIMPTTSPHRTRLRDDDHPDLVGRITRHSIPRHHSRRALPLHDRLRRSRCFPRLVYFLRNLSVLLLTRLHPPQSSKTTTNHHNGTRGHTFGDRQLQAARL